MDSLFRHALLQPVQLMGPSDNFFVFGHGASGPNQHEVERLVEGQEELFEHIWNLFELPGAHVG